MFAADVKLIKRIKKLFSVGNNMIPSPVPEALPGLTQIEEMLIARALPIMKVYVKPGGQRGYSGHCINLHRMLQSLPIHCQDIQKISQLLL